MPNSNHWLKWIGALVLLSLAGCAATPPAEISTATPTSTLTPSPTHTPIPSATPTLIPTLPVEGARLRLLELLANNGNCRLPCLWGITPGKSTYQEALAILSPLSSISESTITGFEPNGGAIFLDYAEDNLTLYASVGFNSDNQIVSRLSFQTREFKIGELDNASALKPIYDSTTFGERVHPYMLPNILSEQGIPAAVVISTDGGPERGKNVPGFYILLLYPDQGLLVSYTTYRQLIGGYVRGCPANAHVEFELFPFGQGDSFSEFLAPTKWATMWPVPPANSFWRPIEEATAMSLEEFYRTFSQPTDKCIETPANLWYVPER
jgi:hypothetical protein